MSQFLSNVQIDGSLDLTNVGVNNALTSALFLNGNRVSQRGLGSMAFEASTSYLQSVGLSLPSIFNPTSATATPGSSSLSYTLVSQTANTVFAAPNGLNGTPSFRQLIAADIPTLVPYTGATGAVNIGSHAFSAGAGTFSGVATVKNLIVTGSGNLNTDNVAEVYIGSLRLSDGNLTVVGNGLFGKSQNTTTSVTVENYSTGLSAAAAFSAFNGTSGISLGIYGTGRSASGIIGSGEPYLSSSKAVNILATGAGSFIKFAAGGNTEVGRFSSTGFSVTGTGTFTDLLTAKSVKVKPTGGLMADGAITLGEQNADTLQIAAFRDSISNGSRNLWLTGNSFTFNAYNGSAYVTYGTWTNTGLSVTGSVFTTAIGTNGTDLIRLHSNGVTIDNNVRIGGGTAAPTISGFHLATSFFSHGAFKVNNASNNKTFIETSGDTLQLNLHSGMNLTVGSNISVTGTGSFSDQLTVSKSSPTYTPTAYNTGLYLNLVSNSADGAYSGIRFSNTPGSREAFLGVVQGTGNAGHSRLVYQSYFGSYGERFSIEPDGASKFYGNITKVGEIGTPSSVAATPATGGSLAVATYFVKVVGVDSTGTSVGSTQASATTDATNNAVNVTWSTLSGATSYRIYVGTTSNGQDRYFTSTTTSYKITAFGTGDGSTAGTVPTTNTTKGASIEYGNHFFNGNTRIIGTTTILGSNHYFGQQEIGNYPANGFYVNGANGIIDFNSNGNNKPYINITGTPQSPMLGVINIDNIAADYVTDGITRVVGTSGNTAYNLLGVNSNVTRTDASTGTATNAIRAVAKGGEGAVVAVYANAVNRSGFTGAAGARYSFYGENGILYNSGNVLIGTTTDTVYKTFISTTGGAGLKISTSGSTFGTPSLNLYNTSSGVDMVFSATTLGELGTWSNHDLVIKTSQTERARFNANGLSVTGKGTFEEVSIIKATAHGIINLYATSPYNSGVYYWHGNSLRWAVQNESATDNYRVYNNILGNDAFKIAPNNAATFASSVTTGGNLSVTGSGNFTLATPTDDEVVRITGTGVLGAGLHLNATDTGGYRWRIISTASSSTPGAGHLGFFAQNQSAGDTGYRMVLRANGNLLLGSTTDNGAKLQVNGAFQATSLLINTTTATAGFGASINANLLLNGSLILGNSQVGRLVMGSTFDLGTHTGSAVDLTLTAYGTERLRVTTSGVKVTGALTVGSASGIYNSGTVALSNTAATAVLSIAKGSFSGLFIDYVITNGTNQRLGRLSVNNLNGTTTLSETTNTDIGTVPTFTFSTSSDATNTIITVSQASTTGYSIKMIYHYI